MRNACLFNWGQNESQMVYLLVIISTSFANIKNLLDECKIFVEKQFILMFCFLYSLL